MSIICVAGSHLDGVKSTALQGVIDFGNEEPSYITNSLLLLPPGDTMTLQYPPPPLPFRQEDFLL